VQIITLTTDLGINSFYVAAIKGILYGSCDNIQVVDVSHGIPPFDIIQAAFVLKNCFAAFPAGTIHIIGIDTDAGVHGRHVLVEYGGQYFIGADNGVFALIFGEEPYKAFEVIHREERGSYAFPTKNVFAALAVQMVNNKPQEELVRPLEALKNKVNVQPIVEEKLIRGSVIYIDNFRNVITNISRDLFETNRKKRNFTIRLRRFEEINEIHTGYSGVPEGEKLCIFNENGYLEIAINRGEAANLLGLRIGSNITIEFN
jgi:S-adenosylmethionine hydrolase